MRILILYVFYILFLSHSLLQNGVTGYGVDFLVLIREIKIKLKELNFLDVYVKLRDSASVPCLNCTYNTWLRIDVKTLTIYRSDFKEFT